MQNPCLGCEPTAAEFVLELGRPTRRTLVAGRTQDCLSARNKTAGRPALGQPERPPKRPLEAGGRRVCKSN